MVVSYCWCFYFPQLYSLFQTPSCFSLFSQCLLFQTGTKAQIQPLDSITREVSLMLNPEMEISATYVEGAEMELFGAKDTPDFTWKT